MSRLTDGDGHLELPDLRIEDETPQGDLAFRDVELVTKHYSRARSPAIRVMAVILRAQVDRPGDVALFLPFGEHKQRQTTAKRGTETDPAMLQFSLDSGAIRQCSATPRKRRLTTSFASVNRRVAGSSPARGAIVFNQLRATRLSSSLRVALFFSPIHAVFCQPCRAPGGSVIRAQRLKARPCLWRRSVGASVRPFYTAPLKRHVWPSCVATYMLLN